MNSTTDTPQTPVAKPVRILVAEDSPLNQQVALKQLEKLGYAADAVADGNEAVAAHTRTPYDIILMDCQMPGMSGYEATWQIRNREQEKAGDTEPPKRVYIIAMTANTQADSREKCLAAGMDDFINKPVQLPELDAAVHRGLADRASQQALEAVIDPVAIAGLRLLRTPGKPDPLTDLIELFLREAPTHLAELQTALRSKDPAAMSRALDAGSALKGSAGNLGARNLAALADEIIQTVKEGLLPDGIPILEKAKKEFDRASEALRKIERGGPGAKG